MSARVPIAVIKGGLQGKVRDLVSTLIPAARGLGKKAHYVGPNPLRPGDNDSRFKVWFTGAVGSWKDYVSGEKGDIIDLVRHIKGGTKADAILWAQNWLGLGDVVDGATLARMQAEVDRRRAADEKKAKEADAAKVSRAFKMFAAARPGLAGTPAETYLASRGLLLADIPNLEVNDVRFTPRLEWWKGARWDRGRKLASGPDFPAIVCAIRQASGELTAVHCTFLAPDGSGKAPVDTPKLMFGLVAGGVIRLTRGPSGLSPEDARERGSHGLVVVGEGLEDGLTLGTGAPEARAWAATSLGNLGNVPLDHPCVSSAIVARDNDWAKPQAREAFERALAQLEAHGVPVGVMQSHHGNDFNDLMRSG